VILQAISRSGFRTEFVTGSIVHKFTSDFGQAEAGIQTGYCEFLFPPLVVQGWLKIVIGKHTPTRKKHKAKPLRSVATYTVTRAQTGSQRVFLEFSCWVQTVRTACPLITWFISFLFALKRFFVCSAWHAFSASCAFREEAFGHLLQSNTHLLRVRRRSGMTLQRFRSCGTESVNWGAALL